MEINNYQSAPDLILKNANIITIDSEFPLAKWVSMKNGIILEVGQETNFKSIKSSKTKIIDCGGKVVLPGFIDPHFHLFSFAESLVTANLGPDSDVRSIYHIQEKLKNLSQNTPPGGWIRCKGYNEFYLEEKRHPSRWDLDKVTPFNPVKLTHRSGHAHVLNSPALKLVGITKETPDPKGGLIDRRLADGEPTGVLFEMGAFLSNLIPSLDSVEIERGLRKANSEIKSLGITSIQDATFRNDLERWKMVQSWKSSGVLEPEVNIIIGLEGLDEIENRTNSTQGGKNQFNLNCIKIILDETTGQLHPKQSELNNLVLKVHSKGLQVAIHAIEESAVASACLAIENALNEYPREDHRHRVEHCSVCTPTLAKKLARLGIIVVTQPPFLYYSGDRYFCTVPSEKFQHLYPIKTLMKNGVIVAGSSDCPIVPPNPLIGIGAAVSRLSETGKPVLESEGISPLEALKIYTLNGAMACFEEKIRGSITPGKVADMVVLSDDPTTSIQFSEIKVEKTILGGRIVWEK